MCVCVCVGGGGGGGGGGTVLRMCVHLIINLVCLQEDLWLFKGMGTD